MKVKEWIEELKQYDENADVVFNLIDDVEVESWTENKYGNKSVSIDAELKENFVCEISGDCRIDLEVVTD